MLRSHDTTSFARRRAAAQFLAVGLLAAACGGSGSAGDTTAAVVATTSTTDATSTTTVPATTTTEAVEAAFTEIPDMVYMTIDGYELLMDVYQPAGEGPWPVVVSFHGLDSHGKDAIDTTVVAEAAAAEGMLVFTPSWIVWNPGPFPIGHEVYESWISTANCAVAFAQQSAAEYGGDPTTTVVDGFSAGIGPSLFASLQPTVDPIAGCETDAPPTRVAGVVLGDGEYFLHSTNFDEAFEADLEAMQAEVASLIDPAKWPPNLDAKFYMWAASGGTSQRPIGDPSDESGWLAQRDPDGSIRADLERLNQLDDGIVSFIDASQLLELRLSEAGIEVTLDMYPGGHNNINKVSELVGYLKAAAG